MYTTIIRERDFTLGGCGATGEMPFFLTHIVGATPQELMSIAV
jgi:hypothetical protein